MLGTSVSVFHCPPDVVLRCPSWKETDVLAVFTDGETGRVLVPSQSHPRSQEMLHQLLHVESVIRCGQGSLHSASWLSSPPPKHSPHVWHQRAAPVHTAWALLAPGARDAKANLMKYARKWCK